MNDTQPGHVMEIKMASWPMHFVVKNESNVFLDSASIFRYVFRNMSNVRLKRIEIKNPIQEYFAFMKDEVDVRLFQSTSHSLEFFIGKAHFTQLFGSYGFHIYSCLDGQGEHNQVLMPAEALGIVVWTTLLLTYLTISLLTAFAFAGRKSMPPQLGGHLTMVKRIWDSCFFYFSHLVLNPIQGTSRRQASWRLLFSGWLLGAGFLLNRMYLCNMKGELVTVKIQYIDTIPQLMARKDIEHIYTTHNLSYASRKYTSQEMTDFSKMILPVKHGSHWNHSVLFTITRFFRDLLMINRHRRGHKPCKNIYKGKEVYMLTSNYVALSIRLPSSVKEAANYRVSRYVDTRQIRLTKIKDEFHYRRELHLYDSRVLPPKRTSLHFVAPVFKAWSGGIVLAIAVIVLELAFNRAVTSIKTATENTTGNGQEEQAPIDSE